MVKLYPLKCGFVSSYWGKPQLKNPFLIPPSTVKQVFSMTLATQKLKPLVHALGATKLNQHRYIKAYKQILSRIMLINKIQMHHVENHTLTESLKAKINSHRSLTEGYYGLLDINNTIDHAPEWLPNWNKYISDFSNTHLNSELGYPKKEKAFQDDATIELMRMQNQSRKTYAVQRIHHAMSEAHKKGWFIIFDTLTLADSKILKFYEDKNCLRDYTRKVGRMILKAEGRKMSDSYTDCYQYIMVPEYGTKNGRLHFHVVHLVRTLPLETRDPNFGVRTDKRHNQQVNTLQYTWNYGMSLPLAVRYSGDAFSRRGWLWPIDKNTGKALESKPLIAVGHYVAKYINKATEQNAIKKDIGESKWNKTLQKTLLSVPQHLFKIRMSRGFGMNTPSMGTLSFDTVIELSQLHWSVTPINKILKENAKKELKLRLSTLTLKVVPALLPQTTNLLKSLRDSMNATQTCNPQSFIHTLTPKLTIMGISNTTKQWLINNELFRDTTKVRTKISLGTK